MNVQPSFAGIYVFSKEDRYLFNGSNSKTNRDYALLHGITRDPVFQAATKGDTRDFSVIRDEISKKFEFLTLKESDTFLLLSDGNDQVKSPNKALPHQGTNRHNDALGDYSLFLALKKDGLDEKAALRELIPERPNSVKFALAPFADSSHHEELSTPLASVLRLIG